ncbi:hypothetical protein PTSG_06890 [Salpingoeca rosetta]|uniref:PX domain-containing protein n=1 Tax=Salpingoeca rosetta (strain ATCC 50818 / BSB-021) TaxID=946362 RepID=F2UF36_SALR5|nr:uncharacterized protein PTSG_06890 [Salpingoeca rosetta]EGD75236.1 hypothetical protein PTSG_06890 [Salpingoeca rosetta]|eukprot:XP_004992289.1 hypothetical protein PTSG_06890 [Salpingoeca rosetta]
MAMLTLGEALGIDRTLLLHLVEKCVSFVLLLLLFFSFVALQIGVLVAIKLGILVTVTAIGVAAGFVYQSAQRFRHVFDMLLPQREVHAGKVHETMQQERERVAIDTRISGSPVIDAELHQVIDLLMRDYVATWYNSISSDPTAIQQTKRLLCQFIADVGIRCKCIDWHDLMTKTLVDVFVKHVKLYRRAAELLETDVRQQQRSLLNMDAATRTKMLEDKFFQIEKDFAKICSDQVRETDYLRDVSEALLYAFLKPEDFDNKLLRFAVREIIATCTLQPVMNMMSDPDYINQFPACLIDDSMLTYNSILDVIKTSMHLDDLSTILANINQSIAAKAEAESQASRSRKYKTVMESLLFARTECQNRIAVITGKPIEKPPVESDTPTVALSSKFVREDPIAVKYLEEFAVNTGQDHVLACWLDIFAFDQNTELKRQQAKAQPEAQQRNFQYKIINTIQREAKEIFFQYISDTSPRRIDLGARQLEMMAEVHENIARHPTHDIFASVRRELERQLDAIHDDFLKSDPYYRCIMSLKLDHGAEYLDSLPKHDPTRPPARVVSPPPPARAKPSTHHLFHDSDVDSDDSHSHTPSPLGSERGSGTHAPVTTTSPQHHPGDDRDGGGGLRPRSTSIRPRQRHVSAGSGGRSRASTVGSGGDTDMAFNDDDEYDDDDDVDPDTMSIASSDVAAGSSTSTSTSMSGSVSGNGNGSESVSRQGSGGAAPTGDEYDGWWAAELVERESLRVKKKMVVFYRLKVTFISAKSGATREWYCLRRYSDFHNFHTELKKRFGHLIEVPLTLPRKTYLKSQSEEFLNARTNDLKTWLKMVMSHSVLEKPGVKKFVAKFLNEDKYVRSNQSLTSKVFRRGHKPSEDDDDDAEAKETAAAMKNFEVNASVPFRMLLALLDVVFELHSNPSHKTLSPDTRLIAKRARRC